MTPMIIAGALALDPDREQAWRSLPLADFSDDDWPQDASLFNGVSPGRNTSVGDVLDALDALSGTPAFFECTDGVVEAFLLADETDVLAQDFATAIRLAPRVGITGEVVFLAFAEELAFRVALDTEDDVTDLPALGWIPLPMMLQDEQTALRFLDTMAFVEAWHPQQVLTRDAYLAERATLGLAPLSEQPLHRAILDELAKADAETLFNAAREGAVCGPRRSPLIATYSTAEALHEALGESEPIARAAAIELLALTAGDSITPRAAELLDDPSDEVVRHAMSALSRSTDDAAMDHLLAVDLHEPRAGFVRVAHSQAIVESRAANGDARVVAALDGDTFAHEAWKAERGSIERVQLAARAAHLMGWITQRGVLGAAPRLLAMFLEHPAEEVRGAAAAALLGIPGADIGEHEQALQYAGFAGIGRALRLDDDRRSEILGVDTRDHSVGIKRFYDLGLDGLGALLAEGFTHPNLQQNDAPPVGELHRLVTAHPELTVSGYSVPVDRPDARVSIDTLCCRDIDTVPEERRTDVRAIFAQLSETATNVDPEGHSLRCWWT